MSEDPKPMATDQPEPVAATTAVEYGEYDVDADVGNVPALLIWIFVAVLTWGIFAWVPFFGGAPGGQW